MIRGRIYIIFYKRPGRKTKDKASLLAKSKKDACRVATVKSRKKLMPFHNIPAFNIYDVKGSVKRRVYIDLMHIWFNINNL